MSVEAMCAAWDLPDPCPEKMVLLILADSSGEHGTDLYDFGASILDLCKRSSLTENQVWKCVDYWEANGVISISIRDGSQVEGIIDLKMVKELLEYNPLKSRRGINRKSPNSAVEEAASR